jgi:hypothetical protein
VDLKAERNQLNLKIEDLENMIFVLQQVPGRIVQDILAGIKKDE